MIGQPNERSLLEMNLKFMFILQNKFSKSFVVLSFPSFCESLVAGPQLALNSDHNIFKPMPTMFVLLSRHVFCCVLHADVRVRFVRVLYLRTEAVDVPDVHQYDRDATQRHARVVQLPGTRTGRAHTGAALLLHVSFV